MDLMSTVVFISVLFPGRVSASVADVTIDGLVTQSNLIVFAKVTKVEDGPADLVREDRSMARLKVATAQVIETWKGKPVGEVHYVASPSWICDTSHAEEGERVVLFLVRREDSPFLAIAHAGRGRMPLRDVAAKSYAEIGSGVILPRVTPTISEERTVRLHLRPTETGKPVLEALTLTYSVESIEFGILRKLARYGDRSTPIRMDYRHSLQPRGSGYANAPRAVHCAADDRRGGPSMNLESRE
jgi:hypothetical protein